MVSLLTHLNWFHHIAFTQIELRSFYTSVFHPRQDIKSGCFFSTSVD